MINVIVRNINHRKPSVIAVGSFKKSKLKITRYCNVINVGNITKEIAIKNKEWENGYKETND
ncbi:hypothetical protein KAU43_06360 [candidate division WOR-3 bacterium]|nr:hypothetical protein [candidate division WOR-3 bacterium]